MTIIARSIRVAAALAVALIAAATTLPATSARATETEIKIEVRIDNFTFAPQRIVVQAGTTVTWTNADDAPHTVVSTTKLFKSSALDTRTNSRSRSRRREPTTTSVPCIRT
jgi:plastocyanin